MLQKKEVSREVSSQWSDENTHCLTEEIFHTRQAHFQIKLIGKLTIDGLREHLNEGEYV